MTDLEKLFLEVIDEMISMPPEELAELLKRYRQQMLKLKEEGSFHEVRKEATSVPIPEFEVHQDHEVPKPSPSQVPPMNMVLKKNQ